MEIEVWTRKGDADWFLGLDFWCLHRHRVGTDDDLLVVGLPGLCLGPYCYRLCLLDPWSVREDLNQARNELKPPIDVDATMRKIAEEYKKVTGKNLPDWEAKR